MAYEVVMPYHLHMPSYFLETFTEYPYKIPVPEELGEAPEYNPRSNNGGKRKGNFKGKRNNSTRKPGNNTNGKKQQK